MAIIVKHFLHTQNKGKEIIFGEVNFKKINDLNFQNLMKPVEKCKFVLKRINGSQANRI